ncbi:cytochrome c-type biogenesis protein CcmH [Leptospira santarosai]|uniref:Cytochrome c-type biogenesis protein n=1 Tax=Leptospira santarosai serovar Arenal str. MAVJ 401 TaxID=1049976 RepID=M6JRB2_9LEPT|nr:cytochrome c-type biogenesis protein CcmH [Leptospira santarosai]EMN22080.1 cytochrome C biogenesis protein [Leptospira santarosai serovar Arenal str. MAVJ 401]EMP02872.1 cytochrome C biogenesis protein [Leptospira santarosai str. HAI1380]EMP80649.1 cytochrome C biogenesis protein [Leptospira santarosai str. CBC1531]MDI7182931.1 cytochrome c-type biogenesis protein CcmH [Leptospira santarosai]MDI7228189.1 cytochrome c-type biogenesis protein CcmH [Leptospira santarosai]
MKKEFYKTLILLTFSLVCVSSLSSDSTFTNLTEPDQIRTFHEVTSKIRCICIPSITIKSCSFNNCTVSAKLKLFIENRIQKGESAEVIVDKMVHGFGKEALNDPVIQKFAESGNTGMANSVVFGFGENILATPDSTWINLSLVFAGLVGISSIYLYVKRKNPDVSKRTPVNQNEDSFRRYLSEIQEKQR